MIIFTTGIVSPLGFSDGSSFDWRNGVWVVGAKIEAGTASVKDLEACLLKQGEVDTNVSGRLEHLKNLINEFIRNPI